MDDDVDFQSTLPANLENTLEDDVGDNDPTVADFIDERPKYVQELERYRKDKRWKTLAGYTLYYSGLALAIAISP